MFIRALLHCFCDAGAKGLPPARLRLPGDGLCAKPFVPGARPDGGGSNSGYGRGPCPVFEPRYLD